MELAISTIGVMARHRTPVGPRSAQPVARTPKAPPKKKGVDEAPRTFLRAWRKKRGLSQEQLAAKLGYSQGMISQWESGESTLDLDHIAELAGALGVTPKQLQYVDPAQEENLEALFDDLPEAEKVRIIEIAKALRRTAGQD